MVEPEAILAALGYAADTSYSWEPFGETPGSPVRLFIEGIRPLEVVVREPAEREAAENHIAVVEALNARGFNAAPKAIATVGLAVVEEAVPGATAMQLVPAPGSAESAMEALAALHSLPLREGLDWGREPSEMFPSGELPLHRLGFAGAEREPAREPLAEAHRHLLGATFGFAHRNAVAANIVLAPGEAWLCDFSTAGFGPQLFDVAAFLLTSGIEAAGRRALSATYAQKRGLSATETVDAVDELGILWGINWLLEVPRRLITSLGDDSATDSLKLATGRIERGIRQAAGDSPTASAIRAALWRS
ncbi:MAG: phosphotransferase [bacterium]